VRTDDSTIATTELKPLIGSVVDADSETLLSGRYATDIRALLEERGADRVHPDARHAGLREQRRA
jgi:hypothetical protein